MLQTSAATPCSERNRYHGEHTIIPESFIFGRGKRLTRSQRRRACEYLVKRDGTACQICKIDLPQIYNCDLDHIDGNRFNHAASNLRRCCHSCNAAAWKEQRASSEGARERWKAAVRPSVLGSSIAAPFLDMVAYRQEKESKFRRAYFSRLLQAHNDRPLLSEDFYFLERNRVRVAASNEAACSWVSGVRYEERLLAENGPIEAVHEYVDGDFESLIFRDSRCYKLTLEQIEELYPQNGFLRKEAREEALQRFLPIQFKRAHSVLSSKAVQSAAERSGSGDECTTNGETDDR